MALTISGVLLCIAGSIAVHFQYRDHLLYYWLGAAIFVVGSVLDILDGALARAGGKTTPFGAFVDSTTDRIGEAFMLGSIGLVFAREGNETALAFTFAALAGGTFLVSYTRAKGEAFGVDTDTGFMQRHERALWLSVATMIAPPVARLLHDGPDHPLHYPILVALAAVALGTNITAARRARLIVARLVGRSA